MNTSTRQSIGPKLILGGNPIKQPSTFWSV
jgi:hypothetical protein